MTGITDVFVAAGKNRAIKYMLDGSTLIIWVGEMVAAAPSEASLGEIGPNGDSFAITVIDDNPGHHVMMPRQPPLLQ